MTITYKATREVPHQYFRYLPRKVHHAMLENMVDFIRDPGTAILVGDSPYPAIRAWCDTNCTKRYCITENDILLFECTTDMTLFLAARPQKV